MTPPRIAPSGNETVSNGKFPQKTIPDDNDVIVVGSGLGGLTAALELARNGLKVCVLEQHRVAGGYAHSFRRRGYHFDISLHYIGGLGPGNMTHGVLSSLGVFDKLNIYRRQTLFTAEFPDFSLVIPNNFEAMMEVLTTKFPAEKKGLQNLFSSLVKLKEDVFGPSMNPDFDVPLDQRESGKYLESTFLDILTEHIKDPTLIAILGQLWTFIGLPASLSCATFSTCVFCSSFIEGAYYITGGGEALVRAMVERLRELGSECITRTPVSRIEIEDGKTVGVTLKDGRFIPAKTVISNANPYQTFFELIPGDEVSKIYRFRLEQMQKSVSLYSLYLGLDCPPSQLGIPEGNLLYNYEVDCEAAYKRAMAGDLDHTDWCSTNYEGSETSMCPPGDGVCSFVEVAPEGDWFELTTADYKIRKKEIELKLLAKYEKRFPGLSQHIVVSEFATPRTMANFTRNPGGAVYGLAQTVEQSNSKRLRNRSPIDGLYMTGSWTWSGGGYEGAMMTGVQSADAVMTELEIPRKSPRMQLSDPEQAKPGEDQTGNYSDTKKTAKALVDLDPNDSYHKFVKPVSVYGDDLNSRGHADASSYLRYMDRGRVDAIEEVCKEAGKESWLTKFVVNVYKIDLDCATVVGVGRPLEVRTGLRKTSSHRATFDQRVVDLLSGEVVADAAVDCLFLDQERNLVPVPSELVKSDENAKEKGQHRGNVVPFSDEAHFPFRIVFRVYYEDTDCQGITYHVSYARFCERALFDMIRTVWPEMTTQAFMKRYKVGVARMGLRYLNSSTLGDRLEVRSGIVGVSTECVTIGQRITFAGTNKIVVDVTTEVEFRNDTEDVVPVPAQVLDAAINAFPQNGHDV